MTTVNWRYWYVIPVVLAEVSLIAFGFIFLIVWKLIPVIAGLLVILWVMGYLNA